MGPILALREPCFDQYTFKNIWNNFKNKQFNASIKNDFTLILDKHPAEKRS